MITVLALIGAKALYLTYAWMASAIAAAWLSDRKGYGEKAGLATGLVLHVVAIVVWLAWPARDDSVWKRHGAFKRLPKPGDE
jgi:fucose permease